MKHRSGELAPLPPTFPVASAISSTALSFPLHCVKSAVATILASRTHIKIFFTVAAKVDTKVYENSIREIRLGKRLQNTTQNIRCLTKIVQTSLKI